MEGRKENPQCIAAQIKQQRGNALGCNARNAAENHRVNDTADQRIQNNPCRAQNGLLVNQHEILTGKQRDQIPILPDFLQIQFQQSALGRYFLVIRIFHIDYLIFKSASG